MIYEGTATEVIGAQRENEKQIAALTSAPTRKPFRRPAWMDNSEARRVAHMSPPNCELELRIGDNTAHVFADSTCSRRADQ